MPAGPAQLLPNAPEYTVSELSSALKRTVEDTYGHVRVRGEISGFRGPHASGHCYFALKDESAKIEAVIWKGVHGRMRFKPQEGLEVIATGKLTTYPSSSKYQIVIEALEPAGIGALMALMEERKKKLAAEGLFDEARKQLLPWLPEVIGVVTSPTGAVIRDILHRLEDRFPRRVLVWPVRVQGEGSAEQIAAAIDGFNALPEDGRIPRPDLLIVARGGGSLEDLWSFNEESVARAIAASRLPIVSAVGHEIDFTIADFVADARAPTPTAAAEMVVPRLADLRAVVERAEYGLVRGLTRRVERERRHLAHVVQRLRDPRGRIRDLRAGTEAATARLDAAMRRSLGAARLRLEACAHRLLMQQPGRRVEELARTVAGLRHRLDLAVRRRLAAAQDDVARAAGALDDLSPLAVLRRGYSLVRRVSDGAIVRTSADLAPGDDIDISFAEGSTRARVLAIPRRRPPRRVRQGAGGS